MCTKGVRIAPIIVKILLFVILPLNVICSLFSFVSPFWFYKEFTQDDYDAKVMEGLWMTCEDGYQNLNFVKEKRCIKQDDVKGIHFSLIFQRNL